MGSGFRSCAGGRRPHSVIQPCCHDRKARCAPRPESSRRWAEKPRARVPELPMMPPPRRALPRTAFAIQTTSGGGERSWGIDSWRLFGLRLSDLSTATALRPWQLLVPAEPKSLPMNNTAATQTAKMSMPVVTVKSPNVGFILLILPERRGGESAASAVKKIAWGGSISRPRLKLTLSSDLMRTYLVASSGCITIAP